MEEQLHEQRIHWGKKKKKNEFPGGIFIHSVKSEPHNSIILFPGQWGALARALVSQWLHAKNLLLIISMCRNLCKVPAQLQTTDVRQRGGEPESLWLLMRERDFTHGFGKKSIQLLGNQNLFFYFLQIRPQVLRHDRSLPPSAGCQVEMLFRVSSSV